MKQLLPRCDLHVQTKETNQTARRVVNSQGQIGARKAAEREVIRCQR